MATIRMWIVKAVCGFSWLCFSALSFAGPAIADAGEGEKVFRKCAACHTVEEGGARKVGPNLFGIVSGPVAAVEGYRYSPALEAYGGEWTPERLDAFLAKPRKEVKGTKMAFAGLRKQEDRDNLISYLASFSAAPEVFDSTGFGANGTVPATASAVDAFGNLNMDRGAETTYYTCTACHSEMIVVQQGLTREGWAEVLKSMVEDHGMPEIDAADRSEILEYLSTHYNESRPNFPASLR
ncbi:MAG: cytochrome c family protein [Sulfitobacter sp.]